MTGGASGIGRALCVALARRGARVAVADRDGEGAEATAQAILADGGSARSTRVDVTDREALVAAIDGVVSDLGGVDFVFNNAGVGMVGEVRDMELAQWRNVIDVDLLGVAYGAHLAYERMLAQGWGHIVNTASMFGLIPSPGLAAYSAAKYGVVALSYALRAEASKLGVRVSVICPGYVDTPIHARSEYPGMDRARFFEGIGPPTITAQEVAAIALRGVERNQFLIFAPANVLVLWWLHKLSAKLTDQGMHAALRLIRRSRIR